MESSHNLFFLFTLSTLLFFFPSSFPHTQCFSHTIQENSTNHVTANITYSNNHHIVTTNHHAATTGNPSNENQGTTQTNIGGTADTDTDVDINLKGIFSKVFAFGDSFTAGNSDSSSSSSLDQQNDNTQGGNTNQHTLVDFICDNLGIPTLPSFKSSSSANGNFQHGINFAMPGASALPKDELDRFSKLGKVTTSFSNVTTENFLSQLDLFNGFLNHLGCKQKDNCKEELGKALFWLGGMGIDDHARTVGSSYSLKWLKEKSVAHISTMLHGLLKNGARHVVVQGLPPLGCLLFEVSFSQLKHLNTLGCAVAANVATMIHNRILQKTITTFRAQYPQAKIVYGDLWNPFLSILKNPSKFQFQESMKACCGAGGKLNFNVNKLCGAPGTSKCSDPSKYIFWDGVYLTAAMNKKLAHLMLRHVAHQLI